jgi:predicted RNase H-like HicB family nuclease
MKTNLRQKAEILAERPYFVKVVQDETTEGEKVWVASNPELEGCFGQGVTQEEAEINLKEARIDFIHSLLEDNLPVPDPQTIATMTSSDSKTLTFSNAMPEFEQGVRLQKSSLRYIRT